MKENRIIASNYKVKKLGKKEKWFMRKMTGEEFDEMVEFFDRMVRTKWLGDIHTELKQITGNWEGLKVLDIGCGTGRLLLRGADEAEKVTGIDLSKEMIQACLVNFSGHEKKSDFTVGDACHLPFENDQFDLSLSTCVLFLLPEPEIGLKEMIRVTKPGGQIAILNPASRMNQEEAEKLIEANQLTGFEKETLLKWSNVSMRRHRLDEEELTQMLVQCGAKDVKHYRKLNGLALITSAYL